MIAPPDDEDPPFESYPPEDDEPSTDPEDEEFARQSHPRRIRRGGTKMPGQDIGHLNLVPMMDIMTMLLVFLVMSFATEPANININLALRPPESSTQDVMETATKVTVTADTILLNDKEIVRIQDLKVASGGRALIPELRAALAEESDYLKALEERGGYPFDGKLLIVAHETTPYSIITSVLTTAGEARFGEYKLVVMQKAATTAP